MIQRIQSIFLLLASLAFFSLFALPLATSAKAGVGFLADKVYNIMDHPALLALTIIGGVTALAAIFLFRNRGLQLRLTILTLVLSILLPVLAYLLVMTEGTSTTEQAVYTESAGIFMPVVALVFSILAQRNIKKDDKLVRSMDRLR
jgi:predicted membrane protein